MTDVGRAAVADDVGGPFVLGSIGVTSTDIAGLKRLKILESAKFVGHFVLCRLCEMCRGDLGPSSSEKVEISHGVM